MPKRGFSKQPPFFLLSVLPPILFCFCFFNLLLVICFLLDYTAIVKYTYNSIINCLFVISLCYFYEFGRKTLNLESLNSQILYLYTLDSQTFFFLSFFLYFFEQVNTLLRLSRFVLPSKAVPLLHFPFYFLVNKRQFID